MRSALESLRFNVQVMIKPETTKGRVVAVVNREDCISEADTNSRSSQRESSKRSSVHFLLWWKGIHPDLQLLLFISYPLDYLLAPSDPQTREPG